VFFREYKSKLKGPVRGWESSLIARKVYAGSYPAWKRAGQCDVKCTRVVGRDNFIGSGE
jgi:hypothetical protein